MQPCCHIWQPCFSGVSENCSFIPLLEKNIGIRIFNSIMAIICQKLIKSLEIWQPCCRIWQPCCSFVIQNGTVWFLIFNNMGIPIFSFLLAISWLKWKATWNLTTFYNLATLLVPSQKYMSQVIHLLYKHCNTHFQLNTGDICVQINEILKYGNPVVKSGNQVDLTLLKIAPFDSSYSKTGVYQFLALYSPYIEIDDFWERNLDYETLCCVGTHCYTSLSD